MKLVNVYRTVTYQFNIDEEQNTLDFINSLDFDSDEVSSSIQDEKWEVEVL